MALQDGQMSADNLVKVLSVSRTMANRHINELLGSKLIVKPRRGYYQLTHSGREYVRTDLFDIDSSFGHLDTLIKHLPSEYHKGFFRLLLCGIIAKHRLFSAYEQGWPSFIIGGPTKTMKTYLAVLACRVLGFDPGDCIKHVQTSTVGELIGRRQQLKGKQGFLFVPSPYWGRQFICLDELDKAEGPLKKQALFYLQGDRAVLIEGKQIESRALPMATLNTDINDFNIPDAYLRRAVVLNTEYFHHELADVDLIARKLSKTKTRSRLSLDKLSLTKERLSDNNHDLLRQLLKANITDKGWGLTDVRPIEILTLGRLPFTDGDIEEAIYQTVFDRLLCAETMGWTALGWRAKTIEEWKRYRSSAPKDDRTSEMAPILTEIKTEVKERVEQVKSKRFEKEEAAAAFIEERSRVVEGFGYLNDCLMACTGNYNKRVTKPLRNKILHSKGNASASKLTIGSNEKLSHYQKTLQDYKQEAGCLLKQWETVRQQHTEQRQEIELLRKGVKGNKNRLKDICELMDRKRDLPPIEVIFRLIRVGAIRRTTQECPKEFPPSFVDVGSYLLRVVGHDLKGLFSGSQSKPARYNYQEVRTAAARYDPEAQELIALLSRGDPRVVLSSDQRYIVISSPRSGSNSKPPSYPEWTTENCIEQVLQGCDKEIYQEADFNSIFSPAARAVLQSLESILRGRLKTSEKRLAELQESYKAGPRLPPAI